MTQRPRSILINSRSFQQLPRSALTFRQREKVMKSDRVTKKLPRLLVVDDDPGITGAIARTLKGSANIQTFNDGRAALRFARSSEVPNLMVLDVCMPEYDSVELLTDMAGIKAFPPIILISGWHAGVLETVAGLAKLLGFEVLGTFIKPFDLACIDGYLKPMDI